MQITDGMAAVVTGGAAAPLIAAALIAGLASMGANYAIKGGRYGWEQAAVDLGMTAVQAITAGVGAQLGAAAQIASKGAAAASTASRSSSVSEARAAAWCSMAASRWSVMRMGITTGARLPIRMIWT